MKKDLKIEQNTVIHCPTKALADKVSVILDRLGYGWYTGKKFTEKCFWWRNKNQHCINPYGGSWVLLTYALDHGHPIISAYDFIKLHQVKFVEVPFDIEKAKNGAKIVDMDGRSVRIICYDRVNPNYPIVALCTDSNANEDAYTFTVDGKFNKTDKDSYLFLLEEQSVETLELNGKSYLKSDIEQALKYLKPINE